MSDKLTTMKEQIEQLRASLGVQVTQLSEKSSESQITPDEYRKINPNGDDILRIRMPDGTTSEQLFSDFSAQKFEENGATLEIYTRKDKDNNLSFRVIKEPKGYIETVTSFTEGNAVIRHYYCEKTGNPPVIATIKQEEDRITTTINGITTEYGVNKRSPDLDIIKSSPLKYWASSKDKDGKDFIFVMKDAKTLESDQTRIGELQRALNNLGIESIPITITDIEPATFGLKIDKPEDVNKAKELLNELKIELNIEEKSNLPESATNSLSGFLAYNAGQVVWKGFTHSKATRGDGVVHKDGPMKDWGGYNTPANFVRDAAYGAMDAVSNYGLAVGGLGFALSALTTTSLGTLVGLSTVTTAATATTAALTALTTAGMMFSGVGVLMAGAGLLGATMKIARMTQEKGPMDALKNNTSKTDIITASVSTAVGLIAAPTVVAGVAASVAIAGAVAAVGMAYYYRKEIGESIYNNVVTKPAAEYDKFQMALGELRKTAMAQQNIRSAFAP